MHPMAKLLRVNRIYGPGNPIPVGKTKFFEDYVHDEGGDQVQFIPGTNVPKLRLAHIGPRTVAGFDDEVAELIEALRRERDKSAPRRSGSTAQRREVVP